MSSLLAARAPINAAGRSTRVLSIGPGEFAALASVLLPATFATLTSAVTGTWALRFFEISVLLAAGFIAVRRAIQPPRNLPPPFPLVLATGGIFGLVQIGAGWSVYAHDTWQATIYWSSMAALALAAVEGLATARARRVALDTFVRFGGIIAVAGIAAAHLTPGRVFGLFESGYPDVWGPFANRNHFAALMELALPVALWNGLQGRRLYVACAVAIAAAGFMCASRAGAILIASECLAIATIAGRRLWRKSLLVLSIAASLALAGGATVAGRFAEPDEFRPKIRQSTAEMIFSRPLTGFGLGTFEFSYPEFAGFDAGRTINHAHNEWMEWIATGGIVFGGWMIALASIALWRSAATVWGLGIPAVFLHALLDYPLSRSGVAVWVVVILAAVEMDRRDPLRERPPRFH